MLDTWPNCCLFQIQPALSFWLQVSQSSQRLGFSIAIFISLHLYFGKNRERRSVGCSLQEEAGLILLMKDKLLFSELDIKDTDANSRSKQEVFLNLFRFKAVFLDVLLCDTQTEQIQLCFDLSITKFD